MDLFILKTDVEKFTSPCKKTLLMIFKRSGQMIEMCLTENLTIIVKPSTYHISVLLKSVDIYWCKITVKVYFCVFWKTAETFYLKLNTWQLFSFHVTSAVSIFCYHILCRVWTILKLQPYHIILNRRTFFVSVMCISAVGGLTGTTHPEVKVT